RDARPRSLERLHRRLLARAAAGPDPRQPLVQALLAADQAAAGYPHVIQHHLGGVRSADPVLAELLSLGKRGRARRRDEARLPSAGSTVATTTCTSAMPPLVAQVLVPLSTHSSVASE